MKSILTTLVVVAATITSYTADAATPTITGVTAQQRYPWNGKVDISYTVTGDIAAEAKQRAVFTSLKVTAIDKVANTTNIATQLSGDTALTAGTHKFVWDMNAEGLTSKSSNVVFNVACETTPATYCVIDLSGGANATSYPVTYLAEPPSGGFNVDAYKTSKLVLKRIEAGTFMMGGLYNVTLTKPYYCGVFEVTQKQYELVMGNNPSSAKGDMRPVETVSWNMIHGHASIYNWPTVTSVDPSKFVGRLQSHTGLNFDLPTEAQWEYACRAGTTSAYNNGGASEDDLKLLGRYIGNLSDNKGGYSGAHTVVGSYLPNAFGLYDMHGNVCEWCLDYDGILVDGMTDPQGPSSGVYRIRRGGGWDGDATFCTSSNRDQYEWNDGSSFGFRIVRTLP